MSTVIGNIQRQRTAWQFVTACVVVFVCLLVTSLAVARDFSFTWSANPEPVEGYKLYYKKSTVACCPFDGTDADQGPSPINVGKVTAFTLTGLDENTSYHFTLTAYNGSEESSFAEIISVVVAEVAPEAVIVTPSQGGVAPLSLDFDGTSSTGTISSYEWAFGDGETAEGSIVSHTYQVAGTYTATLTVASPGGLSHQASTVITVTAPDPVTPPPGSNPTNPTAVISSSTAIGAAPLTMQFDGSASSSDQPPIVTYSWAFGDGGTGAGPTVAHTFSVPGTYSTVLTVTDSAGLSGQVSTPVLVSAATQPASQLPVSSFTATPGAGAPPLKVVLNGSGSSSSGGSITEYRWSLGDGTSATGAVLEHTFTTLGDYVVTLSVTDNKGGMAASTQTLSVRAATPEKNNSLIPIINFILLQREL